MSDPKAGESPTRAFALKLDDWMVEALKADLDPVVPADGTEVAAKAEEAAPAEGDAPKPPVPPKS